MIAIRGWSSSLAQELFRYLPPNEQVLRVERGTNNTTARRHLFAQGIIGKKRLSQMTDSEKLESWKVNVGMTIEQCDLILGVNPEARICVIGSESAYTWSHDDSYAMSKAALHKYVETKRLKPDQQLVCVAPTIIADSRMTKARDDHENLSRKMDAHPKRRFLGLSEVAAMIYHLLYVDLGYTTGIVIRMNGGMHIK